MPAQNVTLTFNQAISQTTLYTNLQNATMTTSATTNNPTALNLSVTDSVMVVKIVAANPSAFSRRLDFGNSTSPVESGFTRFAHTLYDAATGQGWNSLQSTVLGDADYVRDNADVYAEGALKLNNVTTAAAEITVRDFTVTVSDRSLYTRCCGHPSETAENRFCPSTLRAFNLHCS